MKRAVRWSRHALDDLKGQISFISERNPTAARRVAQHIDVVCTRLGEMAVGRRGRVERTYEFAIPRLPYIIAYSIDRDGGTETIHILRIVHTSRHWPPGIWPL